MVDSFQHSLSLRLSILCYRFLHPTLNIYTKVKVMTRLTLDCDPVCWRRSSLRRNWSVYQFLLYTRNLTICKLRESKNQLKYFTSVFFISKIKVNDRNCKLGKYMSDLEQSLINSVIKQMSLCITDFVDYRLVCESDSDIKQDFIQL